MAKKEAKENYKPDMSLPLAERRAKSQKDVAAAVLSKFGSGSIGVASDARYKSVARISSGIFILDYALGGGWPRGRISLGWGNRSSSKSTTMLRTIAQAQKMCALTNKYVWELEDPSQAIPMQVHYCDVEGTFDDAWARKMGVDTDRLQMSRPETQEDAGDIVQAVLESGGCDVLVIDSLAAMVPKDEAEAGQDAWTQGLSARLNGKMFRKINSTLTKMGKEEGGRLTPTVFIINQLRQKIGVMYGSPDVKPGGQAQDFFPCVEVKFSGGQVDYYDGDEKKLPRIAEFNFNIMKNKVSPPRIQGSFKMGLVDDPDGDFKAAEIVEHKDVLDFAERLGVLVKEGPTSWKMYGDKFTRKGDLVKSYVDDAQKYLMLKRDLINRLCPKQ